MALPAALLLATLVSSRLADGCSAAERQSIVRDAAISPLGSVDGRSVVLASLHGGCICGNVNCPYLVLRIGTGTTADVLLSTFAYEVAPAGKALPLPNLRELAHDSALVSDETVDAYRAGKYVVVASARIRSDNGARKPNAVPVRFAPGTSSAALHGNVSLGWYDEFALGAAAGQHIVVGDVHASFAPEFSLIVPGGSRSIDLRPGVPALLPAGGTYLLHVDGGSEADRAYRATVTIR